MELQPSAICKFVCKFEPKPKHELQRIQFQGSEIISAVVAIALTAPHHSRRLAVPASTAAYHFKKSASIMNGGVRARKN